MKQQTDSRILTTSYCIDLFYKESAIPRGQFCMATTTAAKGVAVVCSTCLTGMCVQQCCPPGQVRREDQSWSQPRCAVGEEVGLKLSGICLLNLSNP